MSCIQHQDDSDKRERRDPPHDDPCLVMKPSNEASLVRHGETGSRWEVLSEDKEHDSLKNERTDVCEQTKPEQEICERITTTSTPLQSPPGGSDCHREGVLENSTVEEEEEKDSTATETRRRSVRFSFAEIHEHKIIAGDNPACSCGIPLTIDWERVHVTVVDAIAFQEAKHVSLQSVTNNHKQASSLSSSQHVPSPPPVRYLSALVREKRLQEVGYSRQELVRLCKPVNIARAQRLRTEETLALAPAQEAVERLTKCFRNSLSCLLSKQQRQERKRFQQWKQQQQTTNNSKGRQRRRRRSTGSSVLDSSCSSSTSTSTSLSSSLSSLDKSWSIKL